MIGTRVVCQPWEESERGWGTRPDGYSLHLTENDRKAFIKEYWDSMPNTFPSEYSRPRMGYYHCMIDNDVLAKIKESKNGIRIFSNRLPI